MEKRVFLIVLDSFGIGAEPDAAAFGDEGTNTLGAIAGHPNFNCPNLKKLGLFNIDGVTAGEKTDAPAGAFARLQEQSMGKDTTIGHWEIAGVVVDVGPESARIEKPEQAPHLAVRKVDRRVELEQQHVVRPPVIGITDETFGRLPVRGIGHHRHIDKGLPHTVERTGRAGAGRRQKKQGGQKGRT